MNDLTALFRSRAPFVVLGIVAALHILKWIQVDGYGLGLLLLTFLPALLSVACKYVKTFKLGKDGFEATTIADENGKPASEIEKRAIAVNSHALANSVEMGFPYGAEARGILATLWHYQKGHFGEDSPRRWGFGVGIGAPDYRRFLKGAIQLQDGGLVQLDSRGLCYLTNQGIQFCKMHSEILDSDGPFYNQFTSA